MFQPWVKEERFDATNRNRRSGGRGREDEWGAGTSHGYRDRRKSQLHGHVAERSSDYVEGEVTASWKIRLPVPEKAH